MPQLDNSKRLTLDPQYVMDLNTEALHDRGLTIQQLAESNPYDAYRLLRGVMLVLAERAQGIDDETSLFLDMEENGPKSHPSVARLLIEQALPDPVLEKTRVDIMMWDVPEGPGLEFRPTTRSFSPVLTLTVEPFVCQ